MRRATLPLRKRAHAAGAAVKAEARTHPVVVLASADVGCGHARAAAAVAMGLRTLRPGIVSEVVDALEMAPGWFVKFYRDGYLRTIERFPKVAGWVYDRTDTPGVPSGEQLDVRFEAAALARFCDAEAVRSADVVVCTHFLCARVLSRRKEAGTLRARLVVVVTDQHPHAYWRVPGAELFLVASEAAREEMIRQGVDPRKVEVTGIPIEPRFAEPIDRAAARRKLDLPDDRPVVLITGGGLGLGGIERVFEAMMSARQGGGVGGCPVLVCGRNEAMYDEMVRRFGAGGQGHRVLGLTTRMHELMAAADLMVGKPGGLTTSEALAVGLPMVLLEPLPGQEERNAAALVNAGAGVLEPDPTRAGALAAELARDRARLTTMREAAARLGRPRSALHAAGLVLGA